MTLAVVRSATVGIVVCITPSVVQAQTFEGTVTMRVNAGARAAAQLPGGATQLLEYQVRGGKVRVSMGGPMGGMAMLSVPQEKKLYMLIAAQQAYMEMPMTEAVSAAGAAPQPDVKITRTGKKETIAGIVCEHVLVAPASGQGADMCLTSELGRYVDPAQGMRSGVAYSWQKQLGDGFPLKVTMPDGTVALEVVSVEKKRLPNDLFSVPSNYNKMAMPTRRPPQ